MNAVTSPLLLQIPGLRHGFGTIQEPIPQSLEPEWSQFHPSWKQVHGTHWVVVQSSRQSCGETDALLSFQTGIPAAIVTADCVPILLARKSGGAVAAIHAGWRGTYAGILDRVLDFLRLRGETLSDWYAAIGPAIGPCCYEVSEELAEDFLKKYSWLEKKKLSPTFRHLDLPTIHEENLKKLGVSQIDVLRHCTQCAGGPESPNFHSFRREKNSNRQYSGLVF